MKVVSAEAEWAQERLARRLVEYREIGHVRRASPPRGRHLESQRRTTHANALVDLVSIAESFCSNRLAGVVQVDPSELMTWARREKAWRTKAGVELKNFSKWSQLMGLVEVRNSMQHGLGRLTDHQLGKYRHQVLAWLDSTGVHRNGDQILLATDDVLMCASVCREFITWLDSTAP